MHQPTLRTAFFVLAVLLVGLFIWPWLLDGQKPASGATFGPSWAAPVMQIATITPSVTLTPTRARNYLPYLRRDLSPPTPTPTATFTPTPPPPPIINGGFEEGAMGWVEVSESGRNLIRHALDLPLPPHTGHWATWLGGVDNELAAIGQWFTVPADKPVLVYWMWIDATEACENDVGGISLDEGTGGDPIVVDAYWLCDLNATNGWLERRISLSQYIGRSFTLIFLASTNETQPSSLFIDDVSMQPMGVTLRDQAGPLVTQDAIRYLWQTLTTQPKRRRFGP